MEQTLEVFALAHDPRFDVSKARMYRDNVTRTLTNKVNIEELKVMMFSWM